MRHSPMPLEALERLHQEDCIERIQKTVEKIDIKPASLDDKKEKEPDPSQVYMKAAKAKV